MRAATIVLPLLMFPVASQLCQAGEFSREIFLSNHGDPETVGQSVSGQAQIYTFTLPSSKSVTFKIDADNDACGYELKKSSERNFEPRHGRFPLSLSDSAQKGEIYTISLFQNRLAFIAKTPCAFTLSVQ